MARRRSLELFRRSRNCHACESSNACSLDWVSLPTLILMLQSFGAGHVQLNLRYILVVQLPMTKTGWAMPWTVHTVQVSNLRVFLLFLTSMTYLFSVFAFLHPQNFLKHLILKFISLGLVRITSSGGSRCPFGIYDTSSQCRLRQTCR